MLSACFRAQAPTFARPSSMLMGRTTSPASLKSWCTFSMVEGNSLVQYGHHVAQK
jgi:hypothetical protein